MNEETDGFDPRDYARTMLKSEMVSLFWAIISDKKTAPGGFTLQELADRMGINKSMLSRWFNGTPNWEISTIADLALALGVELQISATSPEHNRLYTPHGVVDPHATVTRGGAQPSGRKNDSATPKSDSRIIARVT